MKMSSAFWLAFPLIIVGASCSGASEEPPVVVSADNPTLLAAAIDTSGEPSALTPLPDLEPEVEPGAAEEAPAAVVSAPPAAEVATATQPTPANGVAAPGRPERVSVYAGVYTAAQANRGSQVQRQECAACHAATEWGQGRLLQGWSGRSAFDLVQHLQHTMPLTAPGSLTLEQYTDVVAYIFQLNAIPVGSEEMPGDPEALRRIELEYRR
jgi:S-disulfanyl-L-cysteine oxidoreductase SoxD